MQRRKFLFLMAALGTACSRPDSPPPAPTTIIDRALGRARATGRPVLVFLLAEEEPERSQREELFAPTLQNADEGTRRALNACELVCATPDLVADHAEVLAGARAVVLDATNDPIRATWIGATLPPIPLTKELDEQQRSLARDDQGLEFKRELREAIKTESLSTTSDAPALPEGATWDLDLPPGSEWLANCPLCGMGYVSNESALFLDHFA